METGEATPTCGMGKQSQYSCTYAHACDEKSTGVQKEGRSESEGTRGNMTSCYKSHVTTLESLHTIVIYNLVHDEMLGRL